MFRPGLLIWAVLALGLALSVSSGTPTADTPGDRRLSLYNIHNGERLDIVYKRSGTYDKEALKKLNWIFRDWRRNESTQMDPASFDLLWEIYEELGARKPIHIVSGYRSPGTNEKLRKAGGGQAKNSQHTRGKALDVHFPDIPVQRLRYSALIRERGGVGYYPTSALPFVHIDTGRVRMWPRMGRLELAALFPNGRSKFVPSDGRPITSADVAAAKKNKKVYETVAAFHAIRNRDRSTTLVASVEPVEPAISASTVALAEVPEPQVVAALDAEDAAPVLDGPALTPPQPVLARPRVASLESFLPPPPELSPIKTRSKKEKNEAEQTLDELVLASLGPDTTPMQLPLKKRATLDDGSEADGVIVPPAPAEMTMGTFLSRTGWARAPDFDEEHPSELSYRPFPLSAFLTADASLDRPVFAKLRHPNFAVAHERLLDADAGLELSFKPESKVAALAWDGQFAPENILLSEMFDGAQTGKRVKTAKR